MRYEVGLRRRRSGTGPLKRGDLVALRPPAEILATLDETGALDRLPFMPEMLRYYGGAHRVSARAERACDAVSRVRDVHNSVMLESVRCDGNGHDGCQAACLIFWKEAWLQRVEDEAAVEAPPRDDAYERLLELAMRNTRSGGDTGAPVTFRCQATDLLQASELVPYWSPRSFLRQVTTRNVSPWTFIRVMAGILANERRRRYRSGHAFSEPGTQSATHEALGLRPGERVRIRPAEEIADTLDEKGKLKGLWFDREMVPYCGTTTTVKAKVERFINENTGEMVELKSDCFILDGVYCKGHISDGRWFCCREINLWWREAWLEREPESRTA